VEDHLWFGNRLQSTTINSRRTRDPSHDIIDILDDVTVVSSLFERHHDWINMCGGVNDSR
jgi:hypothetical protein